MRVRVNVIYEIEVIEDGESHFPDFDNVHDSLTDHFNDQDGDEFETTDGKFQCENKRVMINKIRQL